MAYTYEKLPVLSKLQDRDTMFFLKDTEVREILDTFGTAVTYDVDNLFSSTSDNLVSSSAIYNYIQTLIEEELVTQEDLDLLEQKLTELIEKKADKELVGTLEETGLSNIEGVTNIALAIKKISGNTIIAISYNDRIITLTTNTGETYTADISGLITGASIGELADVNIADIVDKQLLAYNLEQQQFTPVTIDLEDILIKAKQYTDQQIETINHAEAISVDAKPTFADGIITYVKDGETLTTDNTNIWFYYYDENGAIVQTIWIDSVEHTINVGEIDLTDYIKKDQVALYNPDLEQQEYTVDNIASMGMIDYFVNLLKTMIQALNVNGIFADATTGKFAVDATNIPRPDIVEIEVAEDGAETEVRTPRPDVETSLEAIEEKLENTGNSLYPGENITIAEKTIEEESEDGAVTTRDVLEISAGVVNVVESDEAPAAADMKPTQLYAQYGNQSDGFFYRWDANNEVIVKYPADDILIVENLPSYRVARKDRLYCQYTTDAEDNKVLKNTYYFILQSGTSLSWQSLSFEGVVDVEGDTLPEDMSHILLYRLMGVRDTGKLYRYSDKEEKTFAYITEDQINNTYLRKDDLTAGSNVTITPSDDKNPTIISATVLTKVLELPEEPNKDNIYQIYSWVSEYTDMRALNSGGGLSYYYGFRDVDTLPTADEYPDENRLYRLPDNEAMYGWDHFAQDWRTYLTADMKFVEIMPESYEAVDGVLYVSGQIRVDEGLYVYSGEEWFKYTLPGDEVAGVQQVFELPAITEDNILYQLMEREESQWAFFDNNTNWRVFTKFLSLLILPQDVTDRDDNTIYYAEAEDVRYYCDSLTGVWRRYPTDYAVEYVDTIPSETEAQENTVYIAAEVFSTTGLHINNNGIWSKYVPELLPGENIRIKDGVIDAKPIKMVYDYLPDTANIDDLYQICYDVPTSSFAVLRGNDFIYFTQFEVVADLPTSGISGTTVYQIEGNEAVYTYENLTWVKYTPVLVNEFPERKDAKAGILYRLQTKKAHPKIYSYSVDGWVGMEPEFYLSDTVVMEPKTVYDEYMKEYKQSRALKAYGIQTRTSMPTGLAGDPVEAQMLYVDHSKGYSDEEASYLKRYAPHFTQNPDGYIRYAPLETMLKTFRLSEIWGQVASGSSGYIGNVDISTGTDSCFVFADTLMFGFFRAVPSSKVTTTGWKSLGYLNIKDWGYDIIYPNSDISVPTIRNMGNVYLAAGYQSLVLDIKQTAPGKLFLETYFVSSLVNQSLDMNFMFVIPVKKLKTT